MTAMSGAFAVEYLSVVGEGDAILQFELPNSKSDCLIINDPEILSFLGTPNINNCVVATENGAIAESSSPSVPESYQCPPVSDSEYSNPTGNELLKPRKRSRKSENWKVNVRNRNYQSGLKFTNHKGQVRPNKQVKNLKNCLTSCRLHCSQQISEADQKIIFDDYYSLDQAGKYSFISKTTERVDTSRRKRKSDKTSRRKFSYFNFFNFHGNRISVCKQFYLGTLAISQKPIYTVYEKMNMTGTVSKSMKGTRSGRAISQARLDLVLSHINSFPCVESHYCREKTKKKYLDANLNICKMYDLYSKRCLKSNESPVKSSYYRHIFNTRFNLDFFKPKSDKCGLCELFVIDKTKIKGDEYVDHIVFKVAMRQLKEKDKESGVPIHCFDMQKVITCPKTNIDESFYLSKLNVYNLTAHLSTTKAVYCAIWNEATMGWTGNDIASAFIQILERVFAENDITKLITWSDACVPQNKNSFISFAIQHFISIHPEIEFIEMRFSLPGHSCIEEIDNAHSQIEKVLSKNEFFSPIGLMRLLKTINRKRPFQILQMKPCDFKNFEACSKAFNYKMVPFCSLKMLQFTQNMFQIKYSLSYSHENYHEVSIRSASKTTRVTRPQSVLIQTLPSPSIINLNHKPIPINKKKDIEKMFKYMSQQDQSTTRSY